MTIIRRFVAIAILTAWAVCSVASPQNYATTTQTIRAGIVILDSAHPAGLSVSRTPYQYGRSAAPHALYNLDMASSVKPAAWNIMNPHAPGAVSQTMVNRWIEIEGAFPQDLPRVGSPITKNQAEYWAIYLSQVNDAILADYDVLLLNPFDYTEMTPSERAMLYKFVDQGGVLWIDPAGAFPGNGGVDPDNGYPLSFEMGLIGGGGTPSYDAFSPLLNYPDLITPGDLTLIHSAYASTPGMYVDNNASAANATLLTNEFAQFVPIVDDANVPTISTARIGSGEIVVTAPGTSILLNKPAAAGTNLTQNTSYTAMTPILGADGLAAAKLAVNIIGIVADSREAAAGSRKTGATVIDATAPVLSRWSDEGDGAVPTPPAIYKGVVVASTGNFLTVYDANPADDLEGSGDLDNGLGVPGGGIDNNYRDYSLGAPRDIIWQSTSLQGPLSAPTCVEVPDDPSGIRDWVLVVDGRGTLNAFPLLLKNSTGQLIGGFNNGAIGGAHSPAYTVAAPAASGAFASYSSNGAPNAPTVQNELAYVADGAGNGIAGGNPTGRIWAVDLTAHALLGGSTGQPYYLGGSNVQGTPLPGYTASATIGYIPIQDNSGGYDDVLYGPGIVGATDAPGFDSVWIGAKAEVEPNVANAGTGNAGNTWTDSGADLAITTRAGSAGLAVFIPPGGASAAQLRLAPRLSLIDTTGAVTGNAGQVLNSGQMAKYINSGPSSPGGGTVDWTLAAGSGSITAAGLTPRIDYTIDWSADPVTQTATTERGRIMFPVPQNPTASTVTARVLGNIALSAHGTVCMAVSDPSPTGNGANGSLWWLQETGGRGNFNVTGRFSLYPSYTFAFNQAAPVTYDPVFDDSDPLTLNLAGTVPGITNPMQGWRWAGGPSIIGDELVATATSLKGVIPVTVSMGFTADPQVPQLKNLALPSGFTLMQPDFDRSDYGEASPPPLAPDTNSVLSQNTYTYDVNSGVITLPTLATVTRGQISDSLSLSQPVVIVAPGVPDQVVQPEEAGDTWSPLQWYTVWNGQTAQGAPAVTGGTMFFSASSVLPSVMNGVIPPARNAVMNAMDVGISPSDPFIVHPTGKPWMNQAVQLSGGGTPDVHIRMPQASGVSSFSDYIARVNQSVLGASVNPSGVAAGDNTVVAFADQGVYGLGRADFAVCDEGRVLRLDSSGNALFSTNSSVNTGPGGGSFVGRSKSLVRPTKAYAISNSEMLVVDTGGNRVVKLNDSGEEERAISRFFPDPGFKPAGYQGNEPLTLLEPRDAITFSEYVYLPASGAIVSNEQPVEYWTHYLIADSGHKRLLDLIDRFSVNASGQVGSLISVNMPDPYAQTGVGAALAMKAVPQTSVLFWQTPANVSGKNFDYNSVNRVYLPTGATTGQYVYVAGIGSAQPTRANLGLDNPALGGLVENSTGNGGVVIFDTAVGNGTLVYNLFDRPNLQTTPFFDSGTGNYDTGNPRYNQAAMPMSPLTGLKSVSARPVLEGSTALLQIMVTLSDGAYEFLVNPLVPNTTGDLGSPDWMINAGAYTGLLGAPGGGGLVAGNPLQFAPSYAKRLPSGDVLLVNSYYGVTRGNAPYKGEVVMLNGLTGSAGNNGEFGLGKPNMGFNLLSVHYTVKTLSNGVRGIVAPVFADRR